MQCTFLATICGALMLSGCVSNATYEEYSKSQLTPHYDVPAQVIYRIDDHRFVTLENYRDCHHGDTFYHDTKQGFRIEIGREGIENFQGRLINADPTGKNIVIPSSQPPERSCSDRGCSISLIYSTDAGRTFSGWVYMRSFNPYRDSKSYTIAATKDSLYIVKSNLFHPDDDPDPYVQKAPLYPNVDISNLVTSRGKWETGDKAPPFPRGLRSPSGQERLSCDPSMRPTDPDAKLTN